MSGVFASAVFGAMVALAANPSVWTANLKGKDGSKITGTARVETGMSSATTKRDSTMPARDTTTMRDTTRSYGDTTAKSHASHPQTGAGDLRVTITVNNAPQNATLTWGIRSGECHDASAEVKDVASATGSIKVDASGNGTVTSQVKATLPATGDYHVVVNDGGKQAACGDLEAAKTSTEN